MIGEIGFILLAMFSSLVSSTVGFGGAMFLIPLSTFFIPIKNAIAISTLFFLADSCVKVIIYRKKIDWKITGWMLLGGLPFLLLGAFLMVVAPELLLRRLLGVVVLVYVINSIFNLTKNVKLKGWLIALISTAYGFFSGIIGTGGVIKAAMLHHVGLKKERFVGTFAVSAFIFLTIKAVIYSRFELVTKAHIPILIPLIIIGVTGPFVGRRILRKVKGKTFKKAILIMLALVAINLIFF